MVPESSPRRSLNRPDRTHFLPLLPVVLLLALGGQSTPARCQDAAQRHALLVGVGTYQQWPSLVNPIPDVRALEAELRHRYGFLPEVLENPKREDIIAKLRRYHRFKYGPRDQLIIVFAGHGTYDEETRIGYLAAADSETRQRDPNFVSLLSYPWLLALIDNIDCPNILLVVDACYSGSLGAWASSPGSPAAKPQWIRRFLTSGGIEYVPDGDPNRHTPFVRQLLAGLRSPDADGVLTLKGLQDNFMGRVEPQPRWGSFGTAHGDGGFTFVVRGSAPPEQSRTASRGAAPAPQPTGRPTPKPSPASTRLRSAPRTVAESELRRSFTRLEIYDITRNPEGDFPNQYRIQSKDLWDVVADLESGLMWQRSGSDYRMSPQGAVEYVGQLNKKGHAGYRNWRLPTLEELASLLEPVRLADDLYISPHFDTEQETCWSADRDSEGHDQYFISFNAGRAVLAFGAKTAFVRAVRRN